MAASSPLVPSLPYARLAAIQSNAGAAARAQLALIRTLIDEIRRNPGSGDVHALVDQLEDEVARLARQMNDEAGVRMRA